MNTTRTASSIRSAILIGGLLAGSALVAGAIILGSVSCSSDSLQRGLSGAASSTPEEVLAELKDDKSKIDQISDRMMQRIDAFNASRKPGDRTVQFSEIFYDDLGGPQRDILNQMVAEEKDVSYRALLRKITEDRDTIRQLQERVLHLEQTLPDRFVVARKGDVHHDLAMDYLTNEAKLDPAKAKALLDQVDQTDELVPGNKVWFFYDPQRDTFRTYVTRGEAGQTPLAVRRAMKRRLIGERDEAVARAKVSDAKVDELEQTRAGLETQIAGLHTDVAALTERRASLEQEVSSLQTERADLEAKMAFGENSLRYHAENEKMLKESGVLTTVLKRVRDVKGLQFEEALDLRESTTITLAPSDYGLERIRGIRLLPAIYQQDRDFRIETAEDGGAARLVILDPDLFRGKEVILSVRG